MRITRRHVAAAGALVLAAASLPSSSHAESADEAAVKKAVDDLGKAMIAADKAKLDTLLDDRLSYGHSTGLVETKAMFIDAFVSKKTVGKSFVVTEPTVAVYGNIAIARHQLAFEYEDNGKPGVSKPGVLHRAARTGRASVCHRASDGGLVH
jgi:Domain of unknown function (DUF4440)